MIKTVKTQDIKTGMYVVLPKKWFAHPFLKNEFLITSPEQIVKLLEARIVEVSIDTAKSTFPEQKTQIQINPRVKTTPLPIIPPALHEAIYDKKLPAEEKAKAIHKYSIEMMHRLMERPSAESIKEAKKGISEVVDLILADDKTNQQLLSITSHDYNTYVHSVNVGVLGVSLAKIIFRRSDAHNMHELGAGFFLHDLGKVKVDINIIIKPARLTDAEMQEMQRHAQYGYEILTDAHQLTEECKKIVLQHHERENGTGYPQKLYGDAIHIYGRICSIADVFDALVSDRPYKEKLGPFDALKVMKEEMLNHFHKQLFEKFVLLFK